MGISLSSSSGGTGSGTTSNSNLYLLACCIYGEARGESYTGKVAIAAVVLNRVKSSSFPNTISGVIYQPGAFTAVSDGQINLGTNDECIRAAQDALNGWDPTYGCIYYYNPQTATNQWIRSRPIVVTIGNTCSAPDGRGNMRENLKRRLDTIQKTSGSPFWVWLRLLPLRCRCSISLKCATCV